MTLSEIRDNLVSHNEIVAIWYDNIEENYYELIWKGMFWALPDILLDSEIEKIFGAIAESFSQSDTINIEIKERRKIK